MLMLYYMIAFCMGVAIAIQAPINAALMRSISSTPVVSALLSFLIGTLCLAMLAYVSGALNGNVVKMLPQQSWWKYLGGVLGAFFVFGTILLTPKIGLINLFISVLFAQLIASMVLDSVGAFGLEVKKISWEKIVGLFVVFVGLFIFFLREIRGDG